MFGSRYYTFLATDIIIFAMFATSLNLLLGVTGLVSFGHAAYFGIGAYVCAIFMKDLGVPFLAAWLLGGVGGALFAAVFGFFCVRLTSVYFSMLTMAFAQIVWAICFKWNDVTGGEQGYPNVPMPSMAWLEWIPWVGGLRIDHKFFYLTLILAALSIAAMRRIVHSPFGRMLTSIRDNAERAQFIGINVRLYQLIVFSLAGGFAGLAGGLFGIFNRGVFPDFCYWPKSAEVLIMTILGGIHTSGARRSAPPSSSCSTSTSSPTPSTGRSCSVSSCSCCCSRFRAASSAPSHDAGPPRAVRREGPADDARSAATCARRSRASSPPTT